MAGRVLGEDPPRTADTGRAADARSTGEEGTGGGAQLARARVLRKADEGADGPGWTDEATAAALEVSSGTVERLCKRAVLEGPLVAIEHRASPAPPRRRLDGRQEAP